MKPPFPSFTKEWRNDTYDSIAPSRQLAAGKRVVITGASAGIGRGLAQGFAASGAASVAILGRRAEKLDETRALVLQAQSDCKVTTHVADVVDDKRLEAVAKEIGEWDVLVLNHGVIQEGVTIEETSVGEWWNVMEVNVKGTMAVLHAFLPTRSKKASIASVTAASFLLPPGNKNQSAYNTSKFALLKLMEYIAAENPDVHIASFHPGVVKTDMWRASGMGENLPFDTVELPAHFAVWLTSDEAGFLRAKMVSANWDVDELKSRMSDVTSDPDSLTSFHLRQVFPLTG